MAKSRPPKKRRELPNARHQPPPPPPRPALPPPTLYPLVRWHPPPQAQQQTVPFRPQFWQQSLARLASYVIVGIVCLLLIAYAFKTTKPNDAIPVHESYQVKLYKKEVTRILKELAAHKRRDDAILNRIEEMSVRGDYAFSQTRLARNHQALMLYHSVRSYKGLHTPTYAQHEMLLGDVLKQMKEHPLSDPSVYDPVILKAHVFSQQTNIYLTRLENACSTCEQLVNQARF